MTINIYIEGTVLKSTKGIHSKSEKKLRICMEAVWRSGCQWSKIYHNYRSIHKRFKRWCKKGILAKWLKYAQQDPDLHNWWSDVIHAQPIYRKNSQAQEGLGWN